MKKIEFVILGFTGVILFDISREIYHNKNLSTKSVLYITVSSFLSGYMLGKK